MKGKTIRWLPILLLILPIGLFGQEGTSETAGIGISGFFDVVTAFNQPSHEISRFSLNQAELDLTKEVSPTINALLAVCYCSASSTFGVGVATIDIQPFNFSEKSWGVLGKVEAVGLIAGQFDVPFGIDWQQYGSISRKLTTMPSICSETHAGWNDIGLQAYFNTERLNLTAFAVNGFESSFEVTDSGLAIELDVNLGDEINTTPSNAFGARLGIKPIPQAEIGISFAEGLNKSDKVEMYLWGVDSRLTVGNLIAQAEYITHSKNRSISTEKTNGYYIQSEYMFGWLGLTGRFDRIQPMPDGPWSEYISVGNILQIYQAAQIRFEYRLNEGAERDIFYGQLAVSF